MPLTRIADSSSGTLQFYDRLAVHSVHQEPYMALGTRITHFTTVMLFQRIILFHVIASRVRETLDRLRFLQDLRLTGA